MSATALPLPAPDAPYALLREMAEAPALIAQFDASAFHNWHQTAAHKRQIFITGEGSSRIFPAKNMAQLASRHRPAWTVATQGARQAMEMDLSAQMTLGLSNSGRTRELIAFCTQQPTPVHGITATPDSPLTSASTPCAILTCGSEQAVAATKSVIEQALIVQSLLGSSAFDGQHDAATQAAAILAMDTPGGMAQTLAQAKTIYVAGRNDGVAEEIALKSCEITRTKSFYLEGTYVLHGIEEVMSANEAVLLIEPYQGEIERYQKVLREGVNIPVIAIASYDTPFPTLRVPTNKNFGGYLQLMAGWRLLAAAGLLRGVDLDKTVRARKVGNAVESA